MPEIGGTAVRRAEVQTPLPHLRFFSREVKTNAPGSDMLSLNWSRMYVQPAQMFQL